MLAISHAVAGDFDNEREMHVARLAVAREHGDVARTADALGTLAEVALDEADVGRRALVRRGVARHRPARRCPWRRAWRWPCWPARPSSRATSPVPRSTLRRAFAAAEKIGQRLMLAQCYRVAGALAAARGSAAEAVRLYAAAQRLSPSPSGTDDPVEADLLGGLETARSSLAGDVVEREWTLGTSLPHAPGQSPADTTSYLPVPV